MAKTPRKKTHRVAKRKELPDVGYGKVAAAGVAGSLSVIVVYIAQAVLGQPLPAEITSAVQTVFTGVAVYFTHSTLRMRT
jgi:hypothetical protein